MLRFTSVTYKVSVDMVEAYDVFDDHVRGHSLAAERAEVLALLRLLGTNIFHQVLCAYRVTAQTKITPK